MNYLLFFFHMKTKLYQSSTAQAASIATNPELNIAVVPSLKGGLPLDGSVLS